MPIPAEVERRLRQRQSTPQGPKVKRGEAIFAGTDYPHDWTGFIGQEKAKEQLQAQVVSARHRKTRIDHTLLASGIAGIGKTTLAYILAYKAEAGVVAVSGAIDVNKGRTILTSMEDGDILFWDEFHLAVAGNSTKADWTLPFFTDGELLTSRGAEKMPDVTIVAATTDAGRLPRTILTRFMVRPRLELYSDAEGAQIVRNLSDRMGVAVEPAEEPLIARAANNNPRDMRAILTAVRDVAYTGQFSLEKAFEWAGVTYDGLSVLAQDMMLVLLGATNHTMSIDSIQATLGEPGPLRHPEQILLQKGLIVVTGRGRMLTDAGLARADLLLKERAA